MKVSTDAELLEQPVSSCRVLGFTGDTKTDKSVEGERLLVAVLHRTCLGERLVEMLAGQIGLRRGKMGLAENPKEDRSGESVAVVESRPAERIGCNLRGAVEVAAEHECLGRPGIDQDDRVGVAGRFERAPRLV